MEAAFAFLSDTASETLKVDKFEEACGVGMFVIQHFGLLSTLEKSINVIGSDARQKKKTWLKLFEL